MSRLEAYRQRLRHLPSAEWEDLLRCESGLPGPRGNLALAEAVAEEGDETLFLRLLAYDAARAPASTSDEFLHFCGVLGLGKLLAAGEPALFVELRRHANDPRWRTREAVAMALQRVGRGDWPALYVEMARWAQGSLLERRAALAALCEPDLLSSVERAQQTLDLLDGVMAGLCEAPDRRDGAFIALRKGLGYCWSVAMVAAPAAGKVAFERWADSGDRDVRWVLRENLKKKRLLKMDAAWVAQLSARLGS